MNFCSSFLRGIKRSWFIYLLFLSSYEDVWELSWWCLTDANPWLSLHNSSLPYVTNHSLISHCMCPHARLSFGMCCSHVHTKTMHGYFFSDTLFNGVFLAIPFLWWTYITSLLACLVNFFDGLQIFLWNSFPVWHLWMVMSFCMIK